MFWAVVSPFQIARLLLDQIREQKERLHQGYSSGSSSDTATTTRSKVLTFSLKQGQGQGQQGSEGKVFAARQIPAASKTELKRPGDYQSSEPESSTQEIALTTTSRPHNHHRLFFSSCLLPSFILTSSSSLLFSFILTPHDLKHQIHSIGLVQPFVCI